MPLELGRSFNREYKLRIPFSETHVDLSVFFNKKSSFLLFRVNPIIERSNVTLGTKVNMFKNLTTSNFVETFFNMNSYKGDNLDIQNQFENIKDEYNDIIVPVLNEHISLSKKKIRGKEIHDKLLILGFSVVEHIDDFIFIVAERSSINAYIKKKVVRTIGVQIANTTALETLNEYKKTTGW